MKYLSFLSAAALVVAACSDTPDLDEATDELSVTYKANIKSRTLTITGNNADSRLALRLGSTPTRLEVDVGDDGTADFAFDRSKFERIVINAAGGKDVIRMDESSGAFTTEEQVTINGGSGDDTITGGVGAETIIAGGGNDTVTGGGGVDTISLGAGDDTVFWRPGDQSDVIEGGDGFDALVFSMANVDEDIDLSAVGDRLRLTRNIASIAMDIGTLERVELHPQGGIDRVFVHDLGPALVAEVDVDLLSSATGSGDLQPDEVWLDTTTGADTIDIGRDGSAVAATGLPTEVRVVNGEPSLDRLFVNSDASDRININGTAGADIMSVNGDATAAFYDGGGFDVLVAPSLVTPVAVNGLAGDDTITVSSSISAPAFLDGGDGDDQLFGGSGPDVLRGGAGNDVIDGGFGADTVDLGDGNDTFVWAPGDQSDTVDGGTGTDTLRLFGAAIGETFDMRANAGRIRLTRDIASVTLDLGGVEEFDLRTRGGSDRLTVGALAGTSATGIAVDLAPIDGTVGGDGVADTIALDGATTVAVTADGNAVVASGFGPVLRVVNGDPALDRITMQGGTLTIEGTAGADTMVVTADTTGTVYDGGGYNTLVAPSAATAVTVNGNDGDDRITAFGVSTPLVLDGGNGNDTITGGAGADRLLGGPGADVIQGGQGADTVLLGDGDDTAVWNPGDASDVIDGEAGNDVLVFSAANIGEVIDIAANAARVRLTRNVGTVALDLGGIEGIDLSARGGADTITVGDLTGTSVARIGIALADPATGAPDGAVDTVTVAGTSAADQIAITAGAGAVVVSGLAALVQITGSELADQLTVHGGSGTDTFVIGPGIPMTVSTSQD